MLLYSVTALGAGVAGGGAFGGPGLKLSASTSTFALGIYATSSSSVCVSPCVAYTSIDCLPSVRTYLSVTGMMFAFLGLFDCRSGASVAGALRVFSKYGLFETCVTMVAPSAT